MHRELQSPSNIWMHVYMCEKMIDTIIENREDTKKKKKE
jgi:hypothetical protein